VTAADVPGARDPQAPERPASAWLLESVGWLSLEATRRSYEADPGLWRLGEYGRARTIEDYGHHLRAVVHADERTWHDYVRYCMTLFDARGFPQRWLTEAFATLSAILAEALPEHLTADVRRLLDDAPRLMAELAAETGIDLARPTRYDA
jgi:hypothetical protein